MTFIVKYLKSKGCNPEQQVKELRKTLRRVELERDEALRSAEYYRTKSTNHYYNHHDM